MLLVAMRTTSNTLSLTLKDAAQVGDDVTFDYKTKKKDQATGVIQDPAGNDLQSFKGQPVSNDTFDDPNVDSQSPEIAAAEINGDVLTITLSEAIKDTVPKANNFKVKNGRKKIKVEAVSADTDANTVVLSLKDAVEANDNEVTLDYKTKKKDQVTGVIQDLAGNDLQSLKGFEVSNVTTSDAITDLSTKVAVLLVRLPAIGDVVVDRDVLLDINPDLGLAFNPATDGSIFFYNDIEDEFKESLQSLTFWPNPHSQQSVI